MKCYYVDDQDYDVFCGDIIPNYILMRLLGFFDTIWAIICPM